jgi:polygalacturonase
MNRKTTGLIIAFLLVAACIQAKENKAWKKDYKKIERHIVAPEFKDEVYKITDFGAVPGDPAFLNHRAINEAIVQCSSNGGGVVMVPQGIWHCGPITLLENVNLHLEKGATLLFSTDPSQYPLVLTRWEGMDCYNYQPLIYAYEQDNIGITGEGTIDGAGANENWWKMCGAPRFGWTEGVTSQKIGRPLLSKWNNSGTPVKERVLGEGHGMRPQLVNLYRCNNILVEGVSMVRSPFWTLHPLFCTNLTVRNVRFINDGPNGDGCDPESSSYVLIENCYFDTGDDCIAIKSGRNRDGRTANVPSQNIIVRNCTMKNGHGGVVVGSEISGGYRNLFVENCRMDSPELERAIRIKTSSARGGIIEGIYVRNVEVGQCREAVLKINLLYEPAEERPEEFFPSVRDVYLENVTSKKSRYGIMIVAYEDRTNVSNIHLTDCAFESVEQEIRADGKIEDLKLTNVLMNGKTVEH